MAHETLRPLEDAKNNAEKGNLENIRKRKQQQN
jgi:hypothetical protein